MFEPFLMFGGLMFWGFIAFVAVVILAFDVNEKGTHSTFVILAALLVFWVWGDVSLVDSVSTNPYNTLMYIGGYVGLGIGWMIMKWWFYLQGRKEEAVDFKIKFCNRKSIDAENMTDAQRETFIDELTDYKSGYNDKNFPPSAMYNADKIIRWAAYWPFSAFWTILGDGLYRLWNFIYTQFSGLLQKMSAMVFGDV